MDMLKCARSAHLLFLLMLLSGCATRLQQASEPWDKPKTRPIRVVTAPIQVSKPLAKASPARSAPAKGTKPVVIQRPAQATRPATPVASKWQVQPPALPSLANQPGTKPDTTALTPSLKPSLAPLDEPAAGSVVELAQRFLGIKYVYGGESPKEGFDCSGLVHYVFGLKGIPMRRLANEQFLQGEPVSDAALEPGDLVFFSSAGKIVDHVGIYAGGRLFIHAPRTGRTVSYDSLDAPWYSARFQGGRRIRG